jgi:hypothetical protein
MKQYWVLQRDFMAKNPKQQFALIGIKAKDSEAAWFEVENSIQTNNSQEWLMDKKELLALKSLLKGCKKK